MIYLAHGIEITKNTMNGTKRYFITVGNVHYVKKTYAEAHRIAQEARKQKSNGKA